METDIVIYTDLYVAMIWNSSEYFLVEIQLARL